MTYYKEPGANELNDLRGGLTELEYYTTPEIKMPENHAINEINYRGSLA